jgi:uncharacterized protein YegP (UPF0339 family)
MIGRDNIEVFEGGKGGWYWSLRNHNGHVTADGCEPYSTASNARRAARAAGRSLVFARVKMVKRPFPPGAYHK